MELNSQTSSTRIISREQLPFSGFGRWLFATLVISVGGTHSFATAQVATKQETENKSPAESEKSLDDPDQKPAAKKFVPGPAQEKALRYLKALQRRPVPGYLFDRFYNTWLDSATITELESYLTQQAAASKTTADRLLLAFFFSKQGEDVLALEQFRIALKNDPSSAETWYEKAVIEARTLDFETALVDLQKADAAKPKPETAIKIGQLQGTLFARSRETEKAVAVWNKLIAANPKDEGLIEDLIELQISEGLFPESLKLIDKLVAQTKDPYKKVMRQLRKGDILQQSDKRDDALKVYGETLDQVGNETWLEREILSQIAEIFRRDDDFVGLNEHYAKLIESNPKRIALRKAAAKIMVQIGNFDEAIETYKQIVALTPGNRANRESLVEMYSSGGQIDEAIKQVESLIQQYPKDAELYVRLATLQKESDDASAVFRSIESYLTAAKKTEFAFLRAARLLERFKQVENAEKTLTQCIESFPDSTSAKEAYASFLFLQKKKEPAVKIWKSMADGADRSQLLRVARILSSRQLQQESFDVLFARYDDFESDSMYLGQLCAAADSLKKYEDAIPWLLRRVRLAESSVDLELCLGQTVRMIGKSKKVAEQIESLSNEVKKDAEKERPSKSNTATVCLLSELLEKSGQLKEAEELLSSEQTKIVSASDLATNEKADRTQLNMIANQRIRLYSNRQDWSSAANAAKELIEMPGGRSSANLKRLVDLYIRGSQQEEALTWARQWKKSSPTSVLPWFSESQILSRLGNVKESIDVLRRAAQKFPSDPDLFALLAERYTENGQFKDAERIYWRQYEESENLTSRLRWAEQLAQLIYETGDEEALVKNFEERRKSNPTSIEPLLALTQIHRTLDNYEQRREALLEAIQLQPENLELQQQLARAQEADGDWDLAIQTLQGAMQLDKTTRTKEQIARLYMQYGESQKGFDMLFEIAGGMIASARDLEVIVDAIIGAEEWQQAHDFLVPHVTRNPDDYRLKYQLAVIQEELELYDFAKEAFLEILTMDKEITGLKKSQNIPYPIASQESDYAPKDAMQIRNLRYTAREAYSYRNVDRYRGRYGGGYYGGPSSMIKNVPLPEKIDDAHDHAIVHLVEMMVDSSPEDRSTMVGRMSERNVSFAWFLKLMADDGYSFLQSDLREFVIEQLEKGNEDTILFSLAIMQHGNSGDVLNTEILEKSITKLEERYPSLAFFASCSLLREELISDPEAEVSLKKPLELISRMKKPSLGIFQIVQTLRLTDQEMVKRFDKTEMAALNLKLREVYQELSDDPNADYMFALVGRMFESNSKPQEFVEFLDAQVKKHRESKNTGNSGYGYYGYGYGRYSGHGGELIRRLTFPPMLQDFPSGVASLLDWTGEMEDSFYYDPYDDEYGPEPDEDAEKKWAEKFESSISLAKDPILRVMMQLRIANYKSTDQDEIAPFFSEVSNSIDALLKTDPANVDLHLLAASLAVHLEDHEKAIESLESLGAQPISADTRMEIDGFLLGIAMQNAGDLNPEDKSNPIIKAARSAALRIQRNRLDADERAELLQVYSVLEMDAEVEKIASAPSGGASPGFGSFGGFSPGRSSSTSPLNRIRTLLDNGKSDAAIRTMVVQFKALARYFTDPSMQGQGSSEMVSPILRLILAYEIEEEFLNALKESKAKSGRAVFAVAQEFLDREEEAIENYKAALLDDPKNDGVRLRLVNMLMKSDMDAAFACLEEVSEKQLDEILLSILGGMDEQSMSHEIKIQFVEKFCDFWERLDEKNRLAFSDAPISALRMIFATMRSEDEPRLPSLAEIVNKVETDERKKQRLEEDAYREMKSDSAEFKELVARRRSAHDRLCSLLLSHPQSSETAFSNLLASRETAGKLIENELIPYASEAIAAVKPVRKLRASQKSYSKSRMPYGYRNVYGNESKAAKVEMKSPFVFLRDTLMAEGATEIPSQITDVLAQMRENKRSDIADDLENELVLYMATEKDFTDVAKNFMGNMLQTQKQKRTPNVPMQKVIEAYSTRKLSLDLEPFILDFVEANYSKDVAVSIRSYLVHLISKKQIEKARGFISSVSTIYLGDEKSQLEIIELTSGPNLKRLPSQVRKKIGLYGDCLRALLANSRTVWVSLGEVSRLQFQDVLSIQSYSISETFFSHRTSNDFFDALSSSSFTGSFEEFDPIIGPESKETILGAMFSYSSYEIDFVRPFVTQIKAPTFGEQVLQIRFEEPYSYMKMLELFAKHRKAFDQLSEVRKKGLYIFLSEMRAQGDKIDVAKLSPDGLKFNEQFRAYQKSVVEDEIAEFLNTKRISEDQAYEMRSKVKSILSKMDYSDQARVDQVYLKLIDFSKKAPLGRLFSRVRYGDGSNSAESPLSAIFDDCDFERLNAAMMLLYGNKELWVEIGSDECSKAADFFATAFRKSLAAKSGAVSQANLFTESDLRLATEAFVKQAEDNLSKEAQIILLPCLTPMFAQLDSKYRDEIAEWADAEQKKTPNRKSLGIIKDAILFANDLRKQYDRVIKHRQRHWPEERVIAASNEKLDPFGELRLPDEFLTYTSLPELIDRRSEILPYEKRWIELMKLESTPRSIKLFLANFFITFDHQLASDGFYNCLTVIQNGIDSKPRLSDDILLASTFGLLSIEQDENWDRVAADWSNTWKSIYLKGKMEERGCSLSHANFAIQFFGKSDDQAAITRLAKQLPPSVRGRATLVTLLERGASDVARKILSDDLLKDTTARRDDEFEDEDEVDVFYTNKLHQTLQSFLQEFPDEKQRLLVEAYFALLEDTNAPEFKSPLDRDGRLRDIAKRYSELDTDGFVKEKYFLTMLLSTPACDPFIQTKLDGMIEKVKSIDLWGDPYNGSVSGEREFELNQLLVVGHAMLKFRNGDADPFSRLLNFNKRDHPAEDRSLQYHYSSMIENISSFMVSNGSKVMEKASQDDRRRLLTNIKNFVIDTRNTVEFDLEHETRGLINFVFTSHICAGEVSEIRAFIDSIRDSNNKEGSLRGFGDLDSVWVSIANTNPKLLAQDADARFEFVKSVWQIGLELKSQIGSGHFESGRRDSCESCKVEDYGLETIVSAKLLSDDEIAARGSELAEINPLNGEIWRQVGFQQLRVGDFESAAKSFKNALDASKESWDQVKSNRTVEYAFALKKLNRTKVVERLLVRVKKELLLGDNVERYNELQKDPANSKDDDSKFSIPDDQESEQKLDKQKVDERKKEQQKLAA